MEDLRLDKDGNDFDGEDEYDDDVSESEEGKEQSNGTPGTPVSGCGDSSATSIWTALDVVWHAPFSARSPERGELRSGGARGDTAACKDVRRAPEGARSAGALGGTEGKPALPRRRPISHCAFYLCNE